MRKFLTSCVWALLALCVFHYIGLPEARAQTLTELETELAQVQAQLAEARTNLTAEGSAIWRQQHKLENSDPEISEIRKEIVEHERALVHLRRELNARLHMKGSYKDLESRRTDLIRKIQDLVAEEKIIKEEIAILKLQKEGNIP